MIKKIGLLTVGIVAGLVLTEILIEQEKNKAAGDPNADSAAQKKNGLFAEVRGNTVRMYEVRDGHFCGYSEPKTFESQEKAVEWVVKETNAKLV